MSLPSPRLPVDFALEARLRASIPLSDQAPDVVLRMALTGSMAPYFWGINGRLWPKARSPGDPRGPARSSLKCRRRP